jgi:hypothetical protein
MSIAENTMVVNLQIACWSGYKLDKAMSQKVTEDANADNDAARVNKHLVPKESLKEIISAVGALRTHFYANTLPWGDNGDRLLPRLRYMDFMQEHGQHRQTFSNAVEEFLTRKYLEARDQAEFRMGDMFNPNDYPPAEALRRKFSVNLDIHGVATAKDFRVDMNKAEVDSIKRQIEEKNQERVTAAVADVWTRLNETINHFADRMAGDSVFKEATVRNLEAIVEMLPAMNITNDPKLEELRQDINDSLIGYTAKELRKDDAVRAVAAKEAKRIADQMAGFMAAFNQE